MPTRKITEESARVRVKMFQEAANYLRDKYGDSNEELEKVQSEFAATGIETICKQFKKSHLD